MPDEPDYAEDGRLTVGRHELDRDVREVMPAAVLELHFPGGEDERWTPVPHLLDSGPHEQHFAAEVDNAGEARLRFGSGGRRQSGGCRPRDQQRRHSRYR